MELSLKYAQSGSMGQIEAIEGNAYNFCGIWYNENIEMEPVRMTNNIYDVVMCGKSDNSIRFTDFRNLIISYGFVERIKGSHHVFKGMIFQRGLSFNL